MADIAAGDVTYTKIEGTQFSCPSDPRFSAQFTLAFGDGALTYPTGGIPLTKAKLGCPTNLDSLVIMDDGNGDGFIYKFDKSNSKIRIYQSAGFTPAGTNQALTFTGSALAAHRHVLHFQTSAAANAVTAAANSLRTAAAAFDVAGVANSSGEGGVVDVTGGTPAGTINTPTFTGTPVAAGVLVELGSVAVAAKTLKARVVGW